MTTVVVIGGGWAGSAAALSAKKAGADKVIVLKERTCFWHRHGRHYVNNGRLRPEEMIAMGGGVVQIAEQVTTGVLNFPGTNIALRRIPYRTGGEEYL